MEALYQSLALAVSSICPTDFEAAIIRGAIYEDYGDINYDCVTSTGIMEGLESPANIDFGIYKDLKQLQKLMTQQGENPWSNCTFTLQSDGTFKFEVSYE